MLIVPNYLHCEHVFHVDVMFGMCSCVGIVCVSFYPAALRSCDGNVIKP